MKKKIFASALNEIKIGLDNSGRAGKKHILVVSAAVVDDGAKPLIYAAT